MIIRCLITSCISFFHVTLTRALTRMCFERSLIIRPVFYFDQQEHEREEVK
jgi:hypothetical protein